MNENPADLATRGVTFEELKNSSIWWQGPTWLVKCEENWSKHNLPNFSANSYFVNFSAPYVSFIDSHKCSRFSRLQRVFCYCLRFIQKM